MAYFTSIYPTFQSSAQYTLTSPCTQRRYSKCDAIRQLVAGSCASSDELEDQTEGQKEQQVEDSNELSKKMISDGWRADHGWVGQAVIRVFAGHRVPARVIAWLPPRDDAEGYDDEELWRLRHLDDGDEEDCDHRKVLSSRALFLRYRHREAAARKQMHVQHQQHQPVLLTNSNSCSAAHTEMGEPEVGHLYLDFQLSLHLLNSFD